MPGAESQIVLPHSVCASSRSCLHTVHSGLLGGLLSGEGVVMPALLPSLEGHSGRDSAADTDLFMSAASLRTRLPANAEQAKSVEETGWRLGSFVTTGDKDL